MQNFDINFRDYDDKVNVYYDDVDAFNCYLVGVIKKDADGIFKFSPLSDRAFTHSNMVEISDKLAELSKSS